jgi:hypothetical protein
MAVKRAVITVTHFDGRVGSVVLASPEPGEQTVRVEYEPSIGDTARVIANALIPTGLFDRE